MPSIIGQTCQNFTWIVLFDSQTPEEFKARITDFQRRCPQLVPVFVEPQEGRYFAQFFGEEVRKRMDSSARVLSTYLDNDNALNVRFVEDIQNRSESLRTAHSSPILTATNTIPIIIMPCGSITRGIIS